MPEIWIAGHGPRMLGLTGRYGDGWYPTTVVSPQEYAAKLATVRAAAAEAGRNAASITPALHRFVVVGASEQEARAMLETKAVRLLGLGAPADLWRQAGAVHPLGEHFNALVDFVPDHYDRRAVEEAIAAVPDAVMTEGPLLWGTPEQVTAKLAGLRRCGPAPRDPRTRLGSGLPACGPLRTLGHRADRPVTVADGPAALSHGT